MFNQNHLTSTFFMKSVVMLVVLSCFTFNVHAQVGLSSNNYLQQYDRNVIYLKKGGFEKNGAKIPYGSFKKNLKKELSVSVLALPEYKRSRQNMWIGIGCNITAAAFIFSSARSENYRKPLNYAGLGFNLLSIPFKIKAQRQLNHAIWVYNREAIGRN